MRLIAPAYGGLALAEARKLPHAGAARIAIGADLRVDQIGPSGRDAGPHGVAEIDRAIDAYALDAGRSRHGGEMRSVGRPGVGMPEVGRELAAVEIAALQAADRRIGVVVPHHPDYRDLVFDCRAEHARVHEESAVAAHRHASAVGRRELRPERAGDAEAHRTEAHGADERIRPPRLA